MGDINVFGFKKYHLQDIFEDSKVTNVLRVMFEDWFSFLNINKEIQSKLIDSTFDSFKNYSTKTELIEKNLRDQYQDFGIISKIKEKLKKRADHIYTLINPFVNGSIIDVGCGPGEIAQLIYNKRNLPINLTDVIDPELRKSFAPNLPFELKEEEKLPYSNNQFNTSLLITLLHHCNNPLSELEEVKRVTNGNIIIIESVYGIKKDETPQEEYVKNPKFYNLFHNLSEEQQRKYATLLDWFLNKMIIGNEVNCPYNFNSPKNWEKIFTNIDLEILHKKILGIDQPITPEYHILYVVRKNK